MINKEFNFYRGYLDREMAVDGDPGLFAATEVVQAVCDADFQKNKFIMMKHDSSPHCYYKYAKMPENGLYMLRAVKKDSLTTLDILIDTRLNPCFVMIENNADWQEETEEIRNTLEQSFNEDADRLKWHVNLREYKASKTQHMFEFISALIYMYGTKFLPYINNGNMNMGQLMLQAMGDNQLNGDMNNEQPFKFIHPSKYGDEIWEIHYEVKRLVTNHKIPEICDYLYGMVTDGKILLPQLSSVAYAEVVRMGMPTTAGYSEKNFNKYYRYK